MVQGRKGKKRAPQRSLVDDELRHLASVLAEYQLDNNAYGWFRPPWRDGDNAVLLALRAALHDEVYDRIGIRDLDAILRVLDPVTRPSSEAYEAAGVLYGVLVQSKVNTDMVHLLAAGLRCLQVKLANSHGGGTVYNEILLPAFLRIDPKLIADVVEIHRCHDSIRTMPSLRGDRNDRQRAAFTTAWRRGLYLAAYAIPPAF